MSVEIPPISQELIIFLRRKLLVWGKKNYRPFPWRNETDPFFSLVAEILLQRTSAEQVVPVYFEFKEKIPHPLALAEADLSEIEKIIFSLGLAKRAKFLSLLGKKLVQSNSIVPTELQSLLELPGVGTYAATAFLSLHAGVRAAIIDSNVIRFYGRFFGFKTGPDTRRDKEIIRLADRITPKRAFKDFNYALIDFARQVCKPKPNHEICPISNYCKFYLRITITRGG